MIDHVGISGPVSVNEVDLMKAAPGTTVELQTQNRSFYYLIPLSSRLAYLGEDGIMLVRGVGFMSSKLSSQLPSRPLDRVFSQIIRRGESLQLGREKDDHTSPIMFINLYT